MTIVTVVMVVHSRVMIAIMVMIGHESVIANILIGLSVLHGQAVLIVIAMIFEMVCYIKLHGLVMIMVTVVIGSYGQVVISFMAMMMSIANLILHRMHHGRVVMMAMAVDLLCL